MFHSRLLMWTVLLLAFAAGVSKKNKANLIPASVSNPSCVCFHNVTCDVTCNVTCNNTAPQCPPQTFPPPTPCPVCTASSCPVGPPTPAPARKIPAGFAVQPKRIYKFFGCEDAKSWDEANNTCVNDDAHLAIPRTQSEIYLLVGMLILHSPRNHSCQLHIGFHIKEDDGKFYTVLDQPMSSFAEGLWGDMQPDGGYEEECVLLNRNGRLGDGDCDQPAAFACQLKTDDQRG